jgi:hypothetical protein
MQEIPFKTSYRHEEQEMWVLDLKDLPLPDTFKTDLPAHIIYMAPGGWGGNHRHRRTEAFVGIGDDLHIIWRDEAGEMHDAKMMEGKDGLKLFVVPSMLPHLVENRSSSFALLYELYDIPNDPSERLEGTDSLR